ncbi:MAG: ADP-ribosylglycohydrolase family protein [Protaetiibacter sp.]
MNTLHRAQGALLGLAAGDASGFTAMYHRESTMPGRRRLLWTQAIDLDDRNVNKFPLPFSLSAPRSQMAWGPTDDTESAVLAARILLDAGAGADLDALFDSWWRIVEPDAANYRGSVADISAINNARLGERAPITGNDNPHHFDDTAVPRAIPVAIRYAGDPSAAAAVARRLASITNAADGVDAAAAFAAAVAVLLGEGGIPDAIDAARAQLPADGWVARNLARAEQIVGEEGGLLPAVPRLVEEVSNLEYSFGVVAAETVPAALVIAAGSADFGSGLGIALQVPKQADSMPAMVGALFGARDGLAAIPIAWRERLRIARGVCIPSTTGADLLDLAAELRGVAADAA